MALTKEQLEIRKGGITGSEIGAVCGLSPFETPLTVFLRKKGRLPGPEDNADIRRGRHLEAGLAAWWAEEVGATDVREPGTLIHPKDPLIIATPDRAARIASEPLAGEVKAPRYTDGWGNPGTDDVPKHILAQAHWEMAVLEVQLCHVIALLNHELWIYPVRWSQEFFGLLHDAAHRFWTDHILKDAPPPAGQGDGEAVRALSPISKAAHLDVRTLPSDIVAVVEALRSLRPQWKAMGAKYEAIENRLKQIIGDASGLETPWGRIDYRNNKPSKQVDWKTCLQEVQNAIALKASVDPTYRALHEEVLEVVRRNTVEKPGARPFVVRFKEAA